MELASNDVDWAAVSKDTPCRDVVDLILEQNYCKSLKTNKGDLDAFCSTFDACTIWDEDDDDGSGSNETPLDCAALTECNWDGFHESFVGNGICNDLLDGCYNTAICDYDGGDCCPDTCKQDNGRAGKVANCGMEDYLCRDPASSSCDSQLTRGCDPSKTNNEDEEPFTDPTKIKCAEDETMYRLNLYDSFGDGWDDIEISITVQNSSPVDSAFRGGLNNGAFATKYMCMKKSPTCYDVTINGGVWGLEISWEVKPMAEAPALAGGGAPMKCSFGVAGAEGCGTVCEGKSNIDPSKDPQYKEFKEMVVCIENKCTIQIGACEKDEVCDKCYQEIPEEYCYANEAFSLLTDCALCKCSGMKDTDYCESKTNPSIVPPSDKTNPNGGSTNKKTCSPAETLKGGAAVMDFGRCMNFDEMAMMLTDFKNSNFGTLDDFEACSHTFASTPDHGGKKALDCFQILVDAMSFQGKDASVPTKAINALAKSLYQDASTFCECALTASEDCPLCDSFTRFKILLYEALDACRSLDQIDCDAWYEFYGPCQSKMSSKFGTIDFGKTEQCSYIEDYCGGVGPFPAFRKLDCDSELPRDSWEFYRQYAKGCLNQDPGGGTGPQPTPSQPIPTPASKPTGRKPYVPTDQRNNPQPAPAPDVPSGGTDKKTPKPYVPTDGGSKSQPESGSAGKKKGRFRWLWNLTLVSLLVGGTYYVYKRREDGFSFVRYRRMRSTFRDDTDMYSGLSLESSTNFEPPSLPPTPASMGPGGYGGGPFQQFS